MSNNSGSRRHRSGAQFSYTNQQNIGSNSRNTRRTNPNQRLYPELPIDDSSDHFEDTNQDIDDIDGNENVSNSRQETVETEVEEAEEPEGPEEPQNNYKFIFILLTIISLIISYFGFDGNRYFTDYFNYNNEITTNEMNNWLIFQNEFNNFENKYNKVLPDFGLKVMKNAVKSVMNKTSSSMSSDPAVILLIGSNEQLEPLNCIANDLLKAINKAYNEENYNEINGKQTDTNDIIEKFEQTFGVQRKHTIIIKNIESIPSDHIMALHQYTDHQNSIFPDSIIILTAVYHKRIELNKKARMKQMDETASQLFEIKWKDSLPQEQMSALYSRLAPSVVTVLYDYNNEIKC
jgi:hypothetical protein